MRGEKPTSPTPFQSRQRAPGQDAAEQAQAGANPAPTRGPLQTRSASPTSSYTSGMESAMGALADKTHPPKRR
jgi:hypothetical protein